MPLEPFMSIQFTNSLGITCVCWVNELLLELLQNDSYRVPIFSITQYHSGSSLQFPSLLFPDRFWVFLMDSCREKGRGKHSHFHRTALCHLGMQSRDAGPGGSHQKRAQLHEELLSYTGQKPGFEGQSPLPLLPGLFPGMLPPLLVSEHPMGEQETCNQAFT